MSRPVLEIQDQLRGAIMAKLLEGGVTRQDLSAEEFFDPSFATDFDDLAGFDDLFSDMIIWLRDEGFIRYSDQYGGTEGETCVSLCCPTAKAMKQLDEKVPGAGPGTVREITQQGGSDNYGRLGSFFGGLIGGYQSAIGG